MVEIPIVGGNYEDRSLNLNCQIAQNLYPTVDNLRNVKALYAVPGLVPWYDRSPDLGSQLRISGNLTMKLPYHLRLIGFCFDGSCYTDSTPDEPIALTGFLFNIGYRVISGVKLVWTATGPGIEIFSGVLYWDDTLDPTSVGRSIPVGDLLTFTGEHPPNGDCGRYWSDLLTVTANETFKLTDNPVPGPCILRRY